MNVRRIGSLGLSIAGLACLWSCSSSSTQQVGSQYAVSKIVGPQGGTVAVGANDPAIQGTTITIPAGALSSNVNIRIGETNQPVVLSGALGPVVDFEPSGTAFATAATMTIPVQLPQGVDASRVGVMAVEASGAIRTIVPVVVSNGFATFPVSGFTHFGCFDRGEDGNHDDGGCTPTCGDDAECGASDGCGGTCDRNCHTDGGCTPTCGGDAECGASDGCGGTCDRNCHTDGGCTPTCGDNAECGASDGCGGTCDRNCGTDGGGCRPSCGEDAACGSSDGCGGVCEENCVDGGDGCSSTETLCAGDGGLYCADLNESATDCGACRNACGEAASQCVRGVCSCPDGGLLCGEPDAGTPDFCTDASSDILNCGACGNVCAYYASNSTCRLGNCECPEGDQLCGTVGVNANCVPSSIGCDGGG